MSENPEKFPLLCLPTLAAEYVIRIMGSEEMFCLSLTSTRTRALLNISIPKNHVHINCSFWRDKTITLEFPTTSLQFFITEPVNAANLRRFQTYKILNSTFMFSLLSPPIGVNSDVPFEDAAQAFVTHLAESFHSPKISMDLGNVVTPEAALALLKCVKVLHLPMEKVKLGTTNTPVEVYRAFLNEGSRISQQLFLRSEVTPDFQYSPSEIFKLELFHVSDGHWVNLQDYMECKMIVLTNMTSNRNMYSVNEQRLNEFFKAWKGSSCRLEHLELAVYHSTELNFEEITMGLNGTNFTRNDEFQFLDIEREDGRKVRIKLTRMYLTLEKIN